jgi:RNA polymerase sigma-70 factor (ECF subfamily)
MAVERDRLFREFQRDRLRLIAYIRALVGDPDLTEDIFQDVSVIVLQKAEDFAAGGDLQAWCRGIARNVVLREREKSRRLRTFEGDRIIELIDAAFAENAEQDPLEHHHTQLRACMRRLAAPSRELLQLRYDAGLSLRAVALKLGRTEAAVQVALSRVRKWLLECVQRRGETGAEVPS